jgi:hypothetical protein
MLKEGDIYRWSWNEKTLDSKQLEQQSGTLYWCCSRIGIVKNGELVDTFWHGNENKSFTEEQIKEKLDIKFVANIDDLEKAEPYVQALDLDKDCVDLNHPNSTRGNFYIRKGAKKNLNKMKKVLRREISITESQLKYQLSSLEAKKKALEVLSEDSYLFVSSDIPLEDNSYHDEEEQQCF